MDPAAASRLCTAARRLRGLPRLAEEFTSGRVSLAHVTAITDAAVPLRADAIQQMEATLVTLATNAAPRKVKVALRAIADVVDRDGTEAVDDETDLDPTPPPADENDGRRYWTQRSTVDGLVQGEYCVDGLTGEMISILMDAWSVPDSADTPASRRRVPAQRRADAMRAAVKALLDSGISPTVQGVKPHILGMFDLLSIMNRDQAAVFAAELHRTGRVSPATLARLGLTGAKMTPVLTMGPWRVMAVGQTQRTLPAWLRPMLQMLHRHCRGPDCDRPACWAEAHHEDPFGLGGETDLNKTIPLCKAHHDLVSYGGWNVTMGRDNGICTWTAPDGRVMRTYP